MSPENEIIKAKKTKERAFLLRKVVIISMEGDLPPYSIFILQNRRVCDRSLYLRASELTILLEHT
jgi:hypothetical protein